LENGWCLVTTSARLWLVGSIGGEVELLNRLRACVIWTEMISRPLHWMILISWSSWLTLLLTIISLLVGIHLAPWWRLYQPCSQLSCYWSTIIVIEEKTFWSTWILISLWITRLIIRILPIHTTTIHSSLWYLETTTLIIVLVLSKIIHCALIRISLKEWLICWSIIHRLTTCIPQEGIYIISWLLLNLYLRLITPPLPSCTKILWLHCIHHVYRIRLWLLRERSKWIIIILIFHLLLLSSHHCTWFLIHQLCSQICLLHILIILICISFKSSREGWSQKIHIPYIIIPSWHLSPFKQLSTYQLIYSSLRLYHSCTTINSTSLFGNLNPTPSLDTPTT
jgi:hypothetical protein